MKKNEKMKKMKNIKIGIIGFGVGERHLETFLANNNCEVKYICDFDQKKLKKIKKKFPKIICITNSKKIFQDKSINLVSIASYDNYHHTNIMDAIKSKKNIFVEKPLCLSIKEFKEIRNKLNKTNIKISSNYVLRGTTKFKYIKKYSNKIGKIFYLEGDYNYGRISKITHGWRGEIPFYSVTLGGGLHLIDLMLWLNNSKAEKVIAVGNNLSTKNSKFKYYDNVTSLIKFKNGSTAKINSNFAGVTPHHHVFQVFGSKGTILSNMIGTYMVKSRNKKIKPKKIKFKAKFNEKKAVLNSFIEKILNNKNCLVDREVIFKSVSVGLAIEKSLKTKKWENVSL